jgi:hypothetical protein
MSATGWALPKIRKELSFPTMRQPEKAIEGLRDLMAGEMKAGQLNQASFVEIADEAGDLISIVSFEDAVTVTNETEQKPRSQQGPQFA